MVVNWINIAQEKLPWKDILPNVESMLLDDGMTEISKKKALSLYQSMKTLIIGGILVTTVTADVTNIQVRL